MRIVRRLGFWLRIALSIAATFLPVAVVTYPSGQSDGVGVAILMLYVLPGALPYALDSVREFSAFLGIALLALLLVAAPLIPSLLRVLPVKRSYEKNRPAPVCVSAVVVTTCVFIAGHAILNHPYATTNLYAVLVGLILLSFSVDVVVSRYGNSDLEARPMD